MRIALFSFIAVLGIAAVAFVVLSSRESETPQDVHLQKIRQDIESYDNWAVFAVEDGSLCRGNFVAVYNISPGSYMDKRVVPYASKILEVAQESDINVDVISAYSLGLDVESHDHEWFARNAWRFGFIREQIPGFDYGTLRLRFVGVFPAEQMYYSDLSLDEYKEYKENTEIY